MKQLEYWNSVSKTKKFTTPFQEDVFSLYVDKNKKILDVGCGYGRTLDELYKKGYKNLIGVDFSNGMIDRGKEEHPYLDLRVMKDNKIDLPDKSVDAVILFAVLTCIKTNEEQKFLLEEIKRVLKEGGVLYVNDFLLNNDDRNIKRYEKFKSVYEEYGVFELSEGVICRHHSEEWIKELLKDFFVLEYNHLLFKTMNGNKSNGFYFVGRVRK